MLTATPAPDELDAPALRVRVRQLESPLKISEARCAKLDYKLQDLLRRIFDPKSEKLNPAQRSLFGLPETGASAPPQTSAASGTRTARAQRRKGGGRRPHPENLPVRREVITTQIEYQPSVFFRRQIVRPVYASPRRAQAPIVAALPAQVIPQAGVGPGFLTHVVIAKYVDHLPLHRQERIDARGGVWIGRQARCRYVEAVAHLLITVLKRLQRRFRALERDAPLFGKLREAVTYATNRWPHLARYAKVDCGHIHIDQNPVERCFRPTKVGLRNYLFSGHPDAGWRSAVIYSVVGTCRLLGVNPEAYLLWVLPKLAAATNRTAVNLLPHDFARLHPQIDQVTRSESSPSF